MIMQWISDFRHGMAGAHPHAGLSRHLRRHPRSCHRRGGRDVQRRQYRPAPAAAIPGFRPPRRGGRHGARVGPPRAFRPRPGVLPALQGALPAPRRHLPVRCGDLDAAYRESRRTHSDGVSDQRHLRHARRAAAGRAAPGSGGRQIGSLSSATGSGAPGSAEIPRWSGRRTSSLARCAR